ncbi:hypothetical protein MMC07_008710 [Pseudocyphellaria aurata]|nr:hypothetical protein [Pseudocyphellaria aurata]
MTVIQENREWRRFVNRQRDEFAEGESATRIKTEDAGELIIRIKRKVSEDGGQVTEESLPTHMPLARSYDSSQNSKQRTMAGGKKDLGRGMYSWDRVRGRNIHEAK